MAAVYNVTSHTPHTVTLRRVGIHIGPATLVIQRSQITAVRHRLGEVVVDTTDGRAYRVKTGITREQRDLVRQAFGL
jgi:hypothetical protein